MKKFKFRLEPVLRMKKQAEDEKKRIVGELQSKINAQQQQALEINRTILQQGAELKKMFQQGKIDTGWITYYQGFVTDMRQEIARKIQSVAETQKELHLARNALAMAAKETKTLEKLKDKQYQKYKEHLEKLEKKEQDEIANQVFLHRYMREPKELA